jgi:RNA polymerase sigma factor (sigma-70 family)
MFDEQTHSPDLARANPEDMLLKKFDVGSLRECVEGLPVDYREVVVLRELEEMSYREIADVVKIPLGTGMSRLSRARQRPADCVAARVNGGLV